MSLFSQSVLPQAGSFILMAPAGQADSNLWARNTNQKVYGYAPVTAYGQAWNMFLSPVKLGLPYLEENSWFFQMLRNTSKNLVGSWFGWMDLGLFLALWVEPRVFTWIKQVFYHWVKSPVLIKLNLKFSPLKKPIGGFQDDSRGKSTFRATPVESGLQNPLKDVDVVLSGMSVARWEGETRE